MMSILQPIADVVGAKSYLEIGAGSGKTVEALAVERKVAVEPFAVCNANGVTIYKKKSDDAFADGIDGAPFDMIFIDGMHLYDYVVNDLKNALKVLTDKGVIVIHDTNPLGVEDVVADRERSTVMWCGDVWKIILHVCYLMPELDYVTWAQFPGWMVIKRLAKNRMIPECQFELEGNYPFMGLHVSWLKQNKEIMKLSDVGEIVKFLEDSV
jgi:SAM-dependent methyltransferase